MLLLETNPAALTELSRELGWLTQDQTIDDLSVAGEGNMNVVLRARLNPSGSLILKQSLPYVAKFPDIPAPITRIAAEVAFYQHVAASKVAQRMPKLIGFAPDLHLCALQDLGAGEDLSLLYQRDKSHTVPSRTLLRWLSELHRISTPTDGSNDNMAMRVLNHEHIFDLPLREDSGLSFSTALDHFRSGFITQKLRTKAHELGAIYLGDKTQPHSQCLLHGDFYPGSWFQSLSNQIMIIDPEFTFVGPGEFDVGVYLGHLLMCGQDTDKLTTSLQDYVTPEGFNHSLMWQFAGVEVIRRILGVAQLPWRANDATKIKWLEQAGLWMTG